MWAASGKIPLPKTENQTEQAQRYHELDGTALKLNPQIALSACLDLAGDYCHDTSIRLTTIAQKSIVGKIHALTQYSHTRKPEDSLFDSAIVCVDSENIKEIRKEFPIANESNPEYRGIIVIESGATQTVPAEPDPEQDSDDVMGDA